jgi:hypothetical protein
MVRDTLVSRTMAFGAVFTVGAFFFGTLGTCFT